MKNADYAHLLSFIAIVETGSFKQGAYRLGLQPSTLSHNISLLESKLGVPLLTRTTRHVSPTQAGKALYDKIAPAFGDIKQAIENLNDFKKPTGAVRLSAPRTAIERIILPKLPAFMATYPDITLEISADNGFVDIIKSGFDAGIRLGASIQKDMVAVRISPDFRDVVLASPEYLARYGVPKTPQDLTAHRCIVWKKHSGEMERWQFYKDGQTLQVSVPAVIALDDFDFMIQSAVDGMGLVYMTEQYCQPMIDDGRLIPLLTEWAFEYSGFYLYYPSRRMSAALRAFVDWFWLYDK